jgi:3-hydroxyisobutyrate dehydrogenase
MTTDKPAIGFIGLGLMGGPMALNLLNAGWPLTVWNRSADKMAPVVDAGATAASSPAEVAKAADIIFLCVLDTKAVETVIFGVDGIESGGAAGKLVVDCSTASPEAAVTFGERLRTDSGMGFIDSPVTGGVIGATDGTLTLFAGGAATDVERARAPAEAMSRRFLHMGPNGAGQTTKLCNQVMVITEAWAMAECFKLAEAGGVDSRTLPDVFEGGFADSRVMQVAGAGMAAREPKWGAQIKTMLKDLDLVQDAGKALGASLPLTGVATELARLAVAKGMGEEDPALIIKVYD